MARDDEGSSRKGSSGVGGFIGGLTDLVDKLSQLAEKGEQISRTGSFDLGQPAGDGGPHGRPSRGVYGLSVRMGLGGDRPKVEQFGNIRRHEDSGEPIIEDEREPLVDVFDEGDQLMVLAEMPGVEARDVKVAVQGREMELSADRGAWRYRKRLELPSPGDANTVKLSEKNGIVEIRCAKLDKPPDKPPS
jgi:HSP20 family protein